MEIIILIILLIIVLIVKLYKPTIKGTIGEKTTSSILYFLDKSKYKVINNVVLESREITSQIDHIVISDFGIFVIETKNYKGWIFGYESSEYWTQSIYKYKTKFYNPIRQNTGHIKALKSCLNDYPNIEYKSIIVFSTNADLKVKTKTDVVNSNHLLRTIKYYAQVNLTENEKENIFRKIISCNLVDTYNKREHINSITRRIEHREKSVQQNKCPKCGSNLAERKGKFGRFLGCKSYPKCKFTQKIYS